MRKWHLNRHSSQHKYQNKLFPRTIKKRKAREYAKPSPELVTDAVEARGAGEASVLWSEGLPVKDKELMAHLYHSNRIRVSYIQWLHINGTYIHTIVEVIISFCGLEYVMHYVEGAKKKKIQFTP